MKLQEKIRKNTIHAGRNFWPFMEDINSRWLWIRKNKYTTQSSKPASDVDKIYLYTKDSCESKYPLLSNKQQHIGLNSF